MKTSTLTNSSPVLNSTQATSVEGTEPLISNGVKLSSDQIAVSENSSAHESSLLVSSESVTVSSELLPGSEEADLPISEGQGNESSSLTENNATDSPSGTQPPTSNLHEGNRESTPQIGDLQDQRRLQDLDRHSEAESSSRVPDLQRESKIEGRAEPAAPVTIEERTMEETHSKESEPALSASADGPETAVTTTSPQTIETVELPHHPSVPLPNGAKLESPIDPAPSPAQPLADSETQHPEAATNDHIMHDVPPSPAKVARERDDDDVEDEPATKRTKTADNGDAKPEFKVPVLPQINTNTNGARAEPSEAQPTQLLTKPQQKFLLKVIQNVKRLNDAVPFAKPVDIVALNIPNYPAIVTKPMDLRTMEEKVKAELYTSVDDYVEDFNQIVENSIKFNGPDHVVTKNAQNIKASFDKQMTNVPGPEVTEPAPADRKKRASTASTIKAPPSRRESRSSLPGSARSPISAASPSTTFALGPQGVPLIRRDSTTIDGRPKREIHPPASRDLPYASQKPKKKKYQLELKFCQTVLNELQKPKYQSISFPFILPVDPVALNIPHYHKLIKHPMDLSTVSTKLEHGQYENAKEFEADIRLMFQNCYKFNPAADPVHGMGKQFEGVFDEKWALKTGWIESNTPGSAHQSPGSSPDPDDDDDEEEEEEEDEEEENELTKLQQQIAAMSRQVELITKKKKTPPVVNKKAKGVKVTKEKSKKGAPAAPVKTEKRASKPAKKEKTPYVTYEQKQDISNRINSLSETRMATALKIIRDNMPSLKVGNSDFPNMCSDVS